ncbi:MAG: Fur family transcriptional regulator [Gammaproteobacteria bacterium]|jgi:Fur family zinc uptake transcriptional regulator
MSRSCVLSPFKSQQHNHDSCKKAALAEAESACAAEGLKLTRIRRQVLELVWGSHAPIKAYEILEFLQQQNPKAVPPTVYRALEFLQQAGLVHRIESLNAYVGCGKPREPHIGQFLICQMCGAVAEIDEPKITELLTAQAAQLGFETTQQLVELKGLCPQCS